MQKAKACRFLLVLILGLSLPFLTMAENITQASRQQKPGMNADAHQGMLDLNPAEVDFLNRVDFIRICVDPDWMPYDQINAEGQYIGINADFQKLFAQQIGKETRLIKTETWAQSLEYIKARKCDILSSAQITEKRKQYLAFTKPFIRYPIVIATRPDQVFIQGIESVMRQPLTVIKGYAIIEILRQKYPDILIIEVDNAVTGLEMVAKSKAFGYIDTVATIAYQCQTHGILNIKISGVTDEYYDMSVAVRNDQPQLLTIFEKAVDSITETQKLGILNKWLAIKYERKFDYTLAWKTLLAIAFIFTLLLYRQRIISRYNAKLKALNQELEIISKTDLLTGIASRYLLNNTIKDELARVQRYNSKLSILMIDVDFFKSVNDNFGHAVGDQVLKTIANLMSTTIRTNDLIGRWGGEEFLILCPETDLNGALKLAESIRQRISIYDFGLDQPITVSLGVAEYEKTQSLDKLVKCADDALYMAKRTGRNTVKTCTN